MPGDTGIARLQTEQLFECGPIAPRMFQTTYHKAIWNYQHAHFLKPFITNNN